ncbi:hypothetical protein OLEAN_C08460 [Oleispira antarctica RB-8]|uniref:Uncharacterized protein n=1 Tax=Oleispira antarctica RB-8 TaxID=698738 RepID=R4YKP4_OLEAN|nr:hypothetical protein OLEAN_C08460 [Oleispira antarctica RB-8]
MSTYNTINIISQNENGVIYIENESGLVFGIVDAAKITDEDGIPFQESTLEIIEKNFDCDIEQDFEKETSTIYTEDGGALVFSGNDVTIVEFDENGEPVAI